MFNKKKKNPDTVTGTGTVYAEPLPKESEDKVIRLGVGYHFRGQVFETAETARKSFIKGELENLFPPTRYNYSNHDIYMRTKAIETILNTKLEIK